MISNEERRAATARLRQFLSTSQSEHACGYDGLQTVGSLVGTSVGENILARLADLIDRPTCETIEHGRPDESHVCKSCSRCSYGWFEDVHDKPYSYCPNCGAMITEKEEDDDQ